MTIRKLRLLAEDHYTVKADLPGIDPKSIDVNLSGNVITIKGERKEEHEEKNERFYKVERQFGSFYRFFTLPGEVREEGIEAAYKDGVLNVTIPKMAPAKPKKIEVRMQ